MSTYNIIDDLSKVTDISVNKLNQFFNLISKVIVDAVASDNLLDENITEIEIGPIGNLLINHIKNDSSIKTQFKFIPSKQLSSYINNSIINNKSMLEYEIEQSIKQKLLETYKDIL